jgi:hypothetical protein
MVVMSTLAQQRPHWVVARVYRASRRRRPVDRPIDRSAGETHIAVGSRFFYSGGGGGWLVRRLYDNTYSASPAGQVVQ